MNNRNNIFCRKKSLLSHVIIGFLLFFVSVAACSQTTYPVQSYTQLIPPYTSNVPSFYSGTKEKLVCTLINTDMQHPSIQVYLRMKITSSIFSIETPPQVFTPPIELQAGVPVRLSLNDLAVYFKRENMRITGGQNEFFRTQQLPDNFYRFHFEVYETRTNRLLSNPKLGYAQAMIAAGEPPILNLPKMGEVITENNIPNIFFSWTPRHMNSLASAYGTEYEITLVEIPDKNAVPENAFLYSRRLYNETVRSTSFIHTTAQPQLIPGMRYGWRVRAKAKDGIEDVNVFHNEGFSPIFWFDYKADCKPVQMLGAVYENRRMVVTWVANEAIDYTVEYRKKGSYQWYTGTIVEGSCPIFNLKNGETYEYRVGSRCVINDDFVYSEIKACTIPAEEARTPQCGIMPNVNISDKTPLPVLVANLPVFAGDFPVVVTEVQGSNGRFSGKGYVGIPYLGKVRVAVVFNNILVNKSFQLLDGYFETIYDAKNNLVLDIDEVFTGGAGVGDIRSGEELAAYKVDYTIDPKFPAVPKNDTRTQDEIREGKPYILVKSENGFYEFILTDADGNQKEVKASELPATIEDKKGDIYQVSENGEVKPVSTKSDIKLNDTTKEKLRTDIAAISFEPLPATRYALDVYNDVYKESTSVFEKYQLKDEVSKIPASVKFIVPGASDEFFVRVKASNADFDFDKVRFVTGVGKEYKGTPKNDKSGWNLTVVSSEANDGQEIYVVQQTSDGSYATLAKLNVFSYTPKETTINLVAVNGYEISNVDEIAAKLNTIYNKIGLDIKVDIIRGFDYAPLANGEPFSVTGSGLFSQYTADMKALNTAFEGSTYYKEGTPYLFMIKNKAQGVDRYVLGDMPRNKQFGYLFSGADYKTVAHEIGHGLFHLKHLDSYFDNTSHPHLKDNVMNYPAGDSFFKLQWDAIHSPGTVWGMFEKDEDGMWTTDGHYYTLDLLGNLLGLPREISNVLATMSEYPDTEVHDSKGSDMQEKDTWIRGGLQQKYHALTGGYHGVEVAATAYAILKSHRNSITDLYYLYHRFGDCFAHFNIDNDSKGLTSPTNLMSYVNNYEYYVSNWIDKNIKFCSADYLVWTPYGSQPLSKLSGYIVLDSNNKQYVSAYSKEFIIKLFTDFILSGIHGSKFESLISWEDAIEDIDKYLDYAIQNKFRMYGEDTIGSTFTYGHTFDGSKPDQIIRRKKLYIHYLDQLIQLLNAKYSLNVSSQKREEVKNKFQVILDYFSSTDDVEKRIDGVLAYENAKLLNRDALNISIFVPVKYVDWEKLSKKGWAYNKAMANFDGDAEKIRNTTVFYINTFDKDKVKSIDVQYIEEKSSKAKCWKITVIFKNR